MEGAGAAGIECNIYMVPGDLEQSAEEVEDRHVEIVQAVKDAVSVPVAAASRRSSRPWAIWLPVWMPLVPTP